MNRRRQRGVEQGRQTAGEKATGRHKEMNKEIER